MNQQPGSSVTVVSARRPSFSKRSSIPMRGSADAMECLLEVFVRRMLKMELIFDGSKPRSGEQVDDPTFFTRIYRDPYPDGWTIKFIYDLRDGAGFADMQISADDLSKSKYKLMREMTGMTAGMTKENSGDENDHQP